MKISIVYLFQFSSIKDHAEQRRSQFWLYRRVGVVGALFDLQMIPCFLRTGECVRQILHSLADRQMYRLTDGHTQFYRKLEIVREIIASACFKDFIEKKKKIFFDTIQQWVSLVTFFHFYIAQYLHKNEHCSWNMRSTFCTGVFSTTVGICSDRFGPFSITICVQELTIFSPNLRSIVAFSPHGGGQMHVSNPIQNVIKYIYTLWSRLSFLQGLANVLEKGKEKQ